MSTQGQETFEFDRLGTRRVGADFSGGYLSSDGGVLLLRQLDARLALTQRLSECFEDSRHPAFVEHQIQQLIAQRVLGLALGYEDLNDHDTLRLDPLLALAAGNSDPTGQNRLCAQDRGKPLAGSSTLNRLELGNHQGGCRYRKIKADMAGIEQLLLDMGVETLSVDTPEVVLDFDATDDLVHGLQEGRFFHGYHGDYCYLPLYCFVGPVPLWAQLRTSDRDACDGTLEALEQIVSAIRRRCPKARIIFRADSGFCREDIMAWCEAHDCRSPHRELPAPIHTSGSLLPFPSRSSLPCSMENSPPRPPPPADSPSASYRSG